MTNEPMTNGGRRAPRGISITWIARSASAIGIWSLVIGHCVVALAGEPIAIPAALHVHTTFSSGREDLDAVARRARAAGLKAVLFSENYALAFEYGFAPLGGFLRWRERFPSLAPEGLPAYLDAVRRARERHPDLILMPGLEVLPYYYWAGSLLDRAVTMHDGQKNLLVLGLERAEDLAAIPIVGNRRPLGAGEWAARLSPLLLAAAGVWVFRRRGVREERWRGFRVRRRRRHRVAGGALVVLGVLLAVNGMLAGASHWDPMRGPRGYAPHQEAIDFVAVRGGVTVWSLPDARDHSVHRRAGLTVTVRTDPYPQALEATRGYTAFGALYWDTTTVEAPGGVWDRLLAEYLAGRRAGWPVALGESAFHYEGQAGKTLHDAQTVFLASAPTPAAVLDALRAGRAYAHLRPKDFELVLEAFTVNGAGMGGTAPAPPGTPPRIAVALRASDGQPRPVTVRLIRDGMVILERKGTAPVMISLEDRDAPRAGAWYYRLDVRGEQGARLLTNPIFVRVQG